MTEHAVIIKFRYGSTNLDKLFELEDQLEKAISEAKAGEYDGNEIAVDGSDGSLYMYGPDADRLLDVIEPIERILKRRATPIRRPVGALKGT